MERNIAVIGGGHWGKNLVRNFAELGALHTIYDSSPEVLSRFKNLYPELSQGQIEEVVAAISDYASRSS